MKKIASLLVCLILLSSIQTGCGSATFAAASSNASVNVLIVFARAGVRAKIAQEFKKRGVSDEDSAAILMELHQLGDQLLAGKDVRAIVTDPAKWAAARAAALPKLAAIIGKVKVGGVPVYDPVAASDAAGTLLDAFAAIVQSLPPASATAPATTP